MTPRAIGFTPENNLSALLNRIYHVKFSKHVPLVMILLFGVFAVWRTNHYVSLQMQMSWIISWALAVCIELAMLASGASCFISMREAYIRELKSEDAVRSRAGAYVAYVMFGVTTVALLVLSGADGSAESNGNIPFTMLMLLIQFVQSCAILVFLNVADLEEREKLRAAYVLYERELRETRERETAEQEQRQRERDAAARAAREADEERQRASQQSAANRCPYCSKELTPNNRKRHMATCLARPTLAA